MSTRHLEDIVWQSFQNIGIEFEKHGSRYKLVDIATSKNIRVQTKKCWAYLITMPEAKKYLKSLKKTPKKRKNKPTINARLEFATNVAKEISKHSNALYLYLMHSPKHNIYKVGISQKPNRRIRDIKYITGDHKCAILAKKTISHARHESKIHREMKASNANSVFGVEWYKPTNHFFDFVKNEFNLELTH